MNDPHTVDDLTQETLVRVLKVRQKLTVDALPAYAVTTARNLVHSRGREQQRHARHAHRLIDLVEPDRPEEEALRRADMEAVNAAVRRLSERDRREVVAHEVMGEGTSALARASNTTPGAVAVRLAETRAKLRVDYILALQSKEPPTSRCRPVLIALSSGNRRRQERLAVGEHLAECRFCLTLSEPIVQRRRPLAALWPLPALIELKRILGASIAVVKKYAILSLHVAWKFLGTVLPTPATKIAAAAVAALTVGGVVAARDGPGPRTPSRSSTLDLMVEGERVSPNQIANARRFVNSEVIGRDVPVMRDLGDEGFWVGEGRAERIWVEITHTRGESRLDLDAADEVTFTGSVERNPAGYAASVGVAPSGERVLRRQLNHIEVRLADLEKA